MFYGIANNIICDPLSRYDWLAESMSLDLDLVVYLRTQPEVSYGRMRARDRKEESGAPLSYLQHLHTAYEEWLMDGKFGRMGGGTPILVLDANKDLEHMNAVYRNIRDVIRGVEPLPEHVRHADIIYYDHRDNSYSTEPIS